ncbi:MAG: HNH endonuclease [Candidatus Latescibacteria bacterium]|nr:HNH endonuclease [Candidatus Latescibacterota bacterium]
MASINGDWFHSRSSSNLEELLAVRQLVLESRKLEYTGFNWSGGREGNKKMYKFASTINVEPSTMQTKIRAMIRYGFIKDENQCPLIWTKMGNLWNDLYTIGDFAAAKEVYQLTLTISLVIFAFNNTMEQYSVNPGKGDMPLKFLVNNLDINHAISLKEFEALVDGNTKRVGANISYWKADLINSSLFQEVQENLIYTGKYPELIREIKTFEPNPLLIDEDWKAIRDNPLIEMSPFNKSIRTIFEVISQKEGVEEQFAEDITTFPLINAISEQEEIHIPEIDILNTDTRFTTNTRRVRNATWSIRIKKKYNYLCAVTNCDVVGQIFVEAIHIKPDNTPDGKIPHRTHILNGLCLCKHCHVAFDHGYFSLTDDHKIISSEKFNKIAEQNLKKVILSSVNLKIKKRTDDRWPLVDFIQYHRNNIFKE